MTPSYTNSESYYSHGKLEQKIPDTILDQEIKSISASGGWSRMDYMIFI